MNDELDDRFWRCNLDARGRTVRLIMGILALLGAALCWWLWGSAFWASGLLAFGIVGLFEAVRGWCILRALGLRTPF